MLKPTNSFKKLDDYRVPTTVKQFRYLPAKERKSIEGKFLAFSAFTAASYTRVKRRECSVSLSVTITLA